MTANNPVNSRASDGTGPHSMPGITEDPPILSECTLDQRLPKLMLVGQTSQLTDLLTIRGYRVESFNSQEEALDTIKCNPDDYFMVLVCSKPGIEMGGLELVSQAHELFPDLPISMTTQSERASIVEAVQAAKKGAIDFHCEVNVDGIISSVAEIATDYLDNYPPKLRKGSIATVDSIVGKCQGILELKDLILKVAPTNATVLILGESGTGKELVASAIHRHSNRFEANYTRINCAAIPDSLLESELFGHERGSFTGANALKIGRFEAADGGTVFLDEIADMSFHLQAKLLRFLEDGTFTRVGGNETLQVNVRIIAATNADILKRILDNEFREDLYHRLNVIQLRPPPLRQRGADLIILANHLLRQYAKEACRGPLTLSSQAAFKLAEYSWPGNVRELRNAIERAVIIEPSDEIQVSSLPDFSAQVQLHRGKTNLAGTVYGLEHALEEFERHIISKALNETNFHVEKAAERLKITRHQLRGRMLKLKLEVKS